MKILILTEHMHNRLGGIETYTRLLMDYFYKEGHEVSEFSFDLDSLMVLEDEKYFIKQLHRRDIKFRKLLDLRKLTKKIENISKDYDLIINQINNAPWSNNIYKSEKWIFVQHFSSNFFKQHYIAGKFLAPIIYFGMWLFKIKNPFKNFQNHVVFSKSDLDQLKIKKGKTFIIPLAKYTVAEINDFQKNKLSRNDKFLYIGRIDNRQKNVNFIQKIIGDKNKVDFYGGGKINLIKEDKNIKYKGIVKPGDISAVFQKYKWFVLLSKYEGFPFVLVESLSCGVPILISNSFASAKFLTQNFSFLVKSRKKDIDKILDVIKTISDNDYKKLVHKSFEFAKENLSLEAFHNNWNKVLKNFNS
ncbi:MAG: glycosyltransferase family 4 protein [Mycoplasmataceae bacterium]|nr:glycosyltransferase family 4 protein [Mycoplasmataceae bacterium]